MFRRCLLLAAALYAAFVSTPHALAQQTPAPDHTTPPSASAPETTDISVPQSAPKPEWTDISVPPSGTPAPPNLPDLKFPNFTTCPISELEIQVPDVAHIRPAPDQSQLSPLLDKIAAKTVEIANQTPNLISHEEVVSQNGPTRTKESFSYLVLQHSLRSGTLIFDEFRVDVATGEKFETEFSKPSAASTPKPPPSLADLSMPNATKPETSGPMSKGFVGAWLFFYPSNRRLLDFRYLGTQKLHHSEALVFSFAQRSGKTSFSGATVEFGGTTYQVSVQGLAWVDPADFRIVRLRTELLSVPGALPMRQLTSDIEFGQFPISDLHAPLWLPRHVTVAAILGGVASHEDHSYSNYRVFRAHTKIVAK